MAARAYIGHTWISGERTEATLTVDAPYLGALDEIAQVTTGMFAAAVKILDVVDETESEPECETDEAPDTDR